MRAPRLGGRALIGWLSAGLFMTFSLAGALHVLGTARAAPTLPPAESGHRLSARDAAAGWISLFDGATAFGWSEAVVEDGCLTTGVSRAQLARYQLRVACDAASTLTVNGRTLSVRRGRSLHRINGSTGPIRIHPPATIRELCLLPEGVPSLFTDESAWQRIDHPRIAVDRRPHWSWAQGRLLARGGPGALEYRSRPFGDFVLQVTVRTRAPLSNGGVFFRSIPGQLMNGYEAQIYNACENDDVTRPARWSTGAIDDRQNARRLVSRDQEPFTMTVVARGPSLATWVNGFQQVDWTDGRAPHENPRLGLRVAAGTLQLQAHDPDTDQEFVSLRVVELP